MSNGYLTGCGLIISIVITLVIFLKKSINTFETKTFKKMLLLNVFEAFATSMIVVVALTNNSNKLFVILNRIDVNIIIWWSTFFLIYICEVCNIKNKNRFRKLLYFFNSIIFVLSLFLKVNIIAENGILNSYGPLTNLGFYGSAIYILLMIYIVLISLKNKPNMKKLIPFYFLISILILIAYLRTVIPEVNFISILISLLDLIMAFTIENPDLKMLEEYNKNRELVDQTLEEKSNILFKITEDVRTPIKKIKLFSDNILASSDKNLNKKYVENISEISGNLINTIDNTLNISSIDKNNIKIYNSSYDIYNLFNEIIYIIKSKLEETITFKYSINDTIPQNLDGDSSRLKQIICSLLLKGNKENSIIDLDISHIIKNDICRLIITINNSSVNLSLVEINRILSYDTKISDEKLKELDNLNINYEVIKKLIDILNGTLLIKQDEDCTTFTVIIDQLINEKSSRENNISKLSLKLSNKKKILLLNDNYKELTALKKEFQKYNFEVTAIMNSKDLVDMLSGDEKFDIVVIDDEMKNIAAINLIKKISDLKLPNLIKIVALDKNKEFIKEHYKTDYPFDDYLLKNDYKKEIKRLQTKYK